MKIRWTARSIRVRLDDLEVNALLAGQPLSATVSWPGGGWSLELLPQLVGVRGEGTTLQVGLQGHLAQLTDFASEGVTLEGPPRIDIQKDYRPEHLV